MHRHSTIKMFTCSPDGPGSSGGLIALAAQVSLVAGGPGGPDSLNGPGSPCGTGITDSPGGSYGPGGPWWL